MKPQHLMITISNDPLETLAERVLAACPGSPHKRIAIIGCSGSGKSTLARQLSVQTGIPPTSIDALYWQPGWKDPEPNVFQEHLQTEIDRDSWILDGGFLSADNGRRF